MIDKQCFQGKLRLLQKHKNPVSVSQSKGMPFPNRVIINTANSTSKSLRDLGLIKEKDMITRGTNHNNPNWVMLRWACMRENFPSQESLQRL